MKAFKKIAVALSAIPLALAVSTAIPAFSGTVTAEAAEVYGVDFRSGIIKYILEEPLPDTPNTFECTIQIEKDVEGEVGYIFSNDFRLDAEIVGYLVDENGNLVVNWNNYEEYVVFDDVDLRTGEWEHVTVVRNQNADAFELYLNGELAQKMEGCVGETIADFARAHCIGGDNLQGNAYKRPFEGRIGQITVYSDALTAGEVRRDYNNPDSINGETRSDLLFNVKLMANEVELVDTSNYEINAHLGSNNYFYTDEVFETQDYSMIILPDTQCIFNHLHAATDTLADWIVDNAEEKKVGVTITVGDISDGITNGKSWDRQFNKIRQVFGRIETVTPYVAVPGNHDYDNECKTDHSRTHFDGGFPISHISEWECFGGSFSDDSVVNGYYTFEFAGIKYLIFGLDFGPSDDVLEWACKVTEEHLDHRVIMTTHAFLSSETRFFSETVLGGAQSYGWVGKENFNDAEAMWDKWLRKYPNIFMTFCGHVFVDDILLNERTGDHGNVVANFCINGQSNLINLGVESLLSLFTFDETNQLIYINYLSTIRDQLFDFQNQFVYSFKGNTNLTKSYYANTAETNGEKIVTRAETLNAMVERTNFFGTASEGERSAIGMILAFSVVGIAAVALVVAAIKNKEERK